MSEAEVRRSDRSSVRPYVVVNGRGALFSLVQDVLSYDGYTSYDINLMLYEVVMERP